MKPAFISVFINFLFQILLCYNLQAQERQIVPGRLILQYASAPAEEVKLFTEAYKYSKLTLEQCLSEDLGIWLCSYDPGMDGNALINALSKEKLVKMAQFDHYIHLRDVLPDDPSFSMQWALKNTGQAGGVPGADIDATNAWEIEVNEGTTKLGDSIVIAVIDDGFDLEHEDLNFWKNRNEIPGNGIDDDNNGYIDDHDGWNAFTATGEIPEKSHGTRVAGVAGAIGNNGIGICGVGWNCLLMPIAGSSTFESTVVAAFSYVYKMRSLYEETNGERGAFIVVTNGSFGVDFGDPENYPVWKMMYDTLGSLGILSSAATMNHPSDVDIVGDVPTNFESEYLIGVTNTTNTDTKYDVAAWGKVSIDLGAPGTGIISTRTNNTYGYSTGTSLAAPQLSGSVGLLFAAAEEQFLEKYEQDPGEAARFLKNIILDNVDTLQGFATLCVSGGRLNVNKAVRALIAPRIMVSADTIRVFLRPDSAATTKVLLTNLAGFALGFDSRIVSPPDWIYSWTAGGELSAYGQLELLIGLRTDDLDYGTYFSTCEIRDEGGWLIPLVIELTVLDDTKIEEKEKSTILKNAFPNPFTQQVNFSISLEEPAGLQFSIYSYTGKLLDRWEKQYYTGEHIINRDTGTLPGGIYIIEVKKGGVSDQLKVVKASR